MRQRRGTQSWRVAAGKGSSCGPMYIDGNIAIICDPVHTKMYKKTKKNKKSVAVCSTQREVQ